MEEEKSSNTPWASLFTVKFDHYSGYVKDEESAEELIKAYEIATTTRFTVFKQTGGFSRTGKDFIEINLFQYFMPQLRVQFEHITLKLSTTYF